MIPVPPIHPIRSSRKLASLLRLAPPASSGLPAFFALLAFVTLTACSGSSGDSGTTAPSPPTAIRALFLGNSYTASNNLPGVLETMVNVSGSGFTLTTDSNTPGGYRWDQHDADATSTTKIAQGWDFVALQDQSQQPWIYTSTKKSEALSLASKISAVGATTLLFMTWARSTQSLGQNLNVAMYYRNHASWLGATCVPIGRAWERSLADQPSLALYTSDGSHPNTLGTYLGACLFYAALTGASPVGTNDGGLGLAADDVLSLQKTAWNIWTATRAPTSGMQIDARLDAATATATDQIEQGGLVVGDAVGPGGGANASTSFDSGKFLILPFETTCDRRRSLCRCLPTVRTGAPPSPARSTWSRRSRVST